MKSHLESIQKSYDKAIEFGKKGIDLYKDLPEYITSDPDYPKWEAANTSGDSSRKEIKDYLSPAENMKFIDLGCCLNLMFRGYDKWPSIYHGVDISRKTIRLLSSFAAKHQLPIGSLHCGSIHETPFNANYFDIGTCIGVLEYYKKDFVEKALSEIHRIMKPAGKFVLDIPNAGNPVSRIMALIEKHLERPDLFNMSPPEFENMLQAYFNIAKKEPVASGALIQYFLISKKQ